MSNIGAAVEESASFLSSCQCQGSSPDGPWLSPTRRQSVSSGPGRVLEPERFGADDSDDSGNDVTTVVNHLDDHSPAGSHCRVGGGLERAYPGLTGGQSRRSGPSSRHGDPQLSHTRALLTVERGKHDTARGTVGLGHPCRDLLC